MLAMLEQGARYRLNPDIVVPQVFFTLGGPGCGKGTIIGRVAPRFEMASASTGAELLERGLIPPGGGLVPDQTIIPLMIEMAGSLIGRSHFSLLDGAPRTYHQARILAGLMRERKLAFTPRFLVFQTHNAVLDERMVGRGRPDEKDPTVRKERIRVWNEEWPKIESILRSIPYLTHPVFSIVDCTPPVEEVTASTLKALAAMGCLTPVR